MDFPYSVVATATPHFSRELAIISEQSNGLFCRTLSFLLCSLQACLSVAVVLRRACPGVVVAATWVLPGALFAARQGGAVPPRAGLHVECPVVAVVTRAATSLEVAPVAATVGACSRGPPVAVSGVAIRTRRASKVATGTTGTPQQVGAILFDHVVLVGRKSVANFVFRFATQ